jgi:hypothetical protein
MPKELHDLPSTEHAKNTLESDFYRTVTQMKSASRNLSSLQKNKKFIKRKITQDKFQESRIMVGFLLFFSLLFFVCRIFTYCRTTIFCTESYFRYIRDWVRVRKMEFANYSSNGLLLNGPMLDREN